MLQLSTSELHSILIIAARDPRYIASYIAACVFVAAGMFLPSSCLVMDVYSNFTIPAFGRHVIVI
jgi:hypothetical protein